LLAICGLVACRSAATPTLAPTAAQSSETARQPEATATPPQAEATATKAQESAPTATPATVSKAEARPTPAWQIPEVRESEWTKGSEDAGLVIVEYSDYQ
jgi:cell division septation protein DedD